MIAKKLKIFISSVQSEFVNERAEMACYLRQDPLLATFFEPFIFEEVPANTHSPGKLYLTEVKVSDIYTGLLLAPFGFDDEMGVSPTEREYDQAKAEHIPRVTFIKDIVGADRHPKKK